MPDSQSGYQVMCTSNSTTPSLFPGITPLIAVEPSREPATVASVMVRTVTTPLEVEEAEEETITCYTCASEVCADNAVLIEGHSYCANCVYACDNCGDVSIDSDFVNLCRCSIGRASSSKSPRCENCSWKCADCNSWFTNAVPDYGANCAGEKICGDCCENYSYCEQCSSTVENEGMQEIDGEYVCDSCAEELKSSVIHNYEYSPDPVFLRTTKDKPCLGKYLYLGWECEVDHANPRLDNGGIVKSAGLAAVGELYCKRDGSLDYGFEIVSHPGTISYWRDYDYGFMSKLVKFGVRSYETDTCGMHVHLSRDYFSKLDLVKLLRFMKVNKKHILRLSRRKQTDTHRREGKTPLCRYAAIDERSYRELTRMPNGGYDSNGRYRALNLQNSRTIEIRIFKGTLNVASFKRNLDFCHALAHFVKQSSLLELKLSHMIVWLKGNGKAVVGKAESKELVQWMRQRRMSEDFDN